MFDNFYWEQLVSVTENSCFELKRINPNVCKINWILMAVSETCLHWDDKIRCQEVQKLLTELKNSIKIFVKKDVSHENQ